MSGKDNAKHTAKPSSLERSSLELTKEVNKILAEELHKLVIKKFNKRKVYSQFKGNIWGGGGVVV